MVKRKTNMSVMPKPSEPDDPKLPSRHRKGTLAHQETQRPAKKQHPLNERAASLPETSTSEKPKSQPAQGEPTSIWEETHPGETCLFDTMTPAEIDEFRAEKAAMQEKERELGHSSYSPQPEGMTIDDLVEEIKNEETVRDTVAN